MMHLSKDEKDMLLDAIDSHIYWDLSDPFYRRDGDVLEPYTDDSENQEAIKKLLVLRQKVDSFKELEGLLDVPT